MLFGGTGAVFAASPQARETIVASEDIVQSVDNTYIVLVDLAAFDFQLQVTNVQEDDEMYYVTYTYRTVTLVDYVWQNVGATNTMKFSKKELTGRDLGLFVAKQLGEEISAQLAYLTEVQTQEREKGASLKVIATEYSGLIGSMFDPTQKTFEGYEPVVEESISEDSSLAAAAAARPGESFLALPPIPTTQQIEAIVAAAVAAALTQPTAPPTTFFATSTPTTTDEVVDEDIDPEDNEPDPDTGTTTPPAPDPDPATTTPPTPDPEPTPEPTPEPELTAEGGTPPEAVAEQTPEPEPEPTPDPEPTP